MLQRYSPAWGGLVPGMPPRAPKDGRGAEKEETEELPKKEGKGKQGGNPKQGAEGGEIQKKDQRCQDWVKKTLCSWRENIPGRGGLSGGGGHTPAMLGQSGYVGCGGLFLLKHRRGLGRLLGLPAFPPRRVDNTHLMRLQTGKSKTTWG